MRQIAADTGVMTAFVVWEPDGDGYRTMYLVARAGSSARSAVAQAAGRAVRGDAAGRGSLPGSDDADRTGGPDAGSRRLCARSGALADAARSRDHSLGGDDPGAAMAVVARTRAEENRIFVASAAAPSRFGGTLIADPNGRLLAVALDGEELCVAAEVNRALVAHQGTRAGDGRGAEPAAGDVRRHHAGHRLAVGRARRPERASPGRFVYTQGRSSSPLREVDHRDERTDHGQHGRR